MYLFQIWQMQKIEQVYLDMVVTVPAPENLNSFQKRDLLLNCIILWHSDDSAWIRRSGFFLDFWLWRATTARSL